MYALRMSEEATYLLTYLNSRKPHTTPHMKGRHLPK